jgi:predicted pyridoxine 5'-phosphate oxidase superfamily flavin-nucleotide-binding protein
MSKQYPTMAFTEHVKQVQDTYGSGTIQAGRAARGENVAGGDVLTTDVKDFLEGRDTFYVATTTETGWPYVNARGGPRGFLQVVDDHTIGWADFRGNLQYVSTGNLVTDDRVGIIAMDYPSRRRLKIFGRARVVRIEDEPDLAASLTVADHDATVERAVLVTVASYDWNCPQHITPRYSLDELDPRVRNLVSEVDDLRAENSLLRAQLAATGPVERGEDRDR